jgi:hypothetical protein
VNLIPAPPPAKPLYAALGVREDATPLEIRDAYLRIARAHHPDVTGCESPIFLAAVHAYEVLKDPAKRAAYDSSGVDPDAQKELRKTAIGIIQKLAFDAICSNNGDGNLLEQIRSSITGLRKTHQIEERRLLRALDMVDKVARNTKARWKGAEAARDAVLIMIEQQAGGDREKLAAARKAIEILNLALELLSDASYEMPREDVWAGSLAFGLSDRDRARPSSNWILNNSV